MSEDSTERYYADMEAARNRAEKAYFDARPGRGLEEQSAVFRAGFERGFNLLWQNDQAMQRRLTEVLTDNRRLQDGLKFYAEGHHFMPEEASDWEDVSGEPPNFLCDENGNTVEDGSIAKKIIEGWAFAEDEDAPMIPPPSLAHSAGDHKP